VENGVTLGRLWVQVEPDRSTPRLRGERYRRFDVPNAEFRALVGRGIGDRQVDDPFGLTRWKRDEPSHDAIADRTPDRMRVWRKNLVDDRPQDLMRLLWRRLVDAHDDDTGDQRGADCLDIIGRQDEIYVGCIDREFEKLVDEISRIFRFEQFMQAFCRIVRAIVAYLVDFIKCNERISAIVI
jgi:hypothetical protein